MRALFLLAVTLAFAPACAGNSAQDEEGDDGELTTDRIANRADLFAKDLYYLRITGWDDGRMTPDSLRDEQTVQGAELSMFVADPKSRTHCPDAESTSRQLVYQTNAFSLRTSGNMTNGTPKSSYKIGLEEKDDRLFKMSALNLKSMWNDVSQMREALAWRIFAEAKVVAPRHTYAKLCINGRYYGLYSMIEQVDKSFLKDRFKDHDDGNLYKAYWLDIGPATLEHRKDSNGDDSGKQYKKASNVDDRTYQLKTNDKDDDPAELQSYDDLATFVRSINRGAGGNFASPEYATEMESRFDVKGYLRWAAVNSLLGAWDNYWATPANYYVYNAGRSDADDIMASPYFVWIPWDYDNTFGVDFHDARWHFASIVDWPSSTLNYYKGQGKAKLPLIQNLLQNDAFLRYYLDAIEHLNDTIFTDAWIARQIGNERSGLRARVQESAYLEADAPTGAPHTGRQFTNDEIFRHGFDQNEAFKNGAKIEGILHFVRMRHDSVKNQLAELRRKHPKGSSGARFPAEPTPIP